jgi:hypothetical protein
MESQRSAPNERLSTPGHQLGKLGQVPPSAAEPDHRINIRTGSFSERASAARCASVSFTVIVSRCSVGA